MKMMKQLSNEKLFDPLVSIKFSETKYIDLHNDFFFDGIVFDNLSNKVLVSFQGDNGGEKVTLTFLTIKALEFSFRFNGPKDDEKVLLDMFSRGEDSRFTFPADRYFFIDFTNGLHVDFNCEGCLLEYEMAEE